MSEIIKYPRTNHLEGSRFQAGDEDLRSVSFSQIKGSDLVVEEKVDGANCGISFDEGGVMLLQSRGHFLTGGPREKQFALFKTWAQRFRNQLYDLLGSRYIMYGEWLYAKHTVFYDELPHYFLEFDIFDKDDNKFLSTPIRRNILKPLGFISSVRVLYTGRLENISELTDLLKNSNYISNHQKRSLQEICVYKMMNFQQVLKETDVRGLMEGLYIKIEEIGKVTERCKFLRQSFSAAVNNNSHWSTRRIIPNGLQRGIDIFGMDQKYE